MNSDTLLQVMRTGFLLMNHVGRCYFKYTVQLVLEKYRHYIVGNRINPILTVRKKRLGHSTDFCQLTHDRMLAGAVQASRTAQSLTATAKLITFVEDVAMTRLQQVNNHLLYRTADGRVFNLTLRTLNEQRVVTLFRAW